MLKFVRPTLVSVACSVLGGLAMGAWGQGEALAQSLPPGLKSSRSSSAANSSCAPNVSVTGQIVDRGRKSSLDLSQVTPMVSVGHKIDVDDFEDRCINEVRVQLFTSPGCNIELHFRADGEQQLVLQRAVFEADSYCPGWADAVEGQYTATRARRETITIDPYLVPDRMAERSCAALEMVAESIELSSDRVHVRIEDLVIEGVFESQGTTAGYCPRPTPMQRMLETVKRIAAEEKQVRSKEVLGTPQMRLAIETAVRELDNPRPEPPAVVSSSPPEAPQSEPVVDFWATESQPEEPEAVDDLTVLIEETQREEAPASEAVSAPPDVEESRVEESSTIGSLSPQPQSKPQPQPQPQPQHSSGNSKVYLLHAELIGGLYGYQQESSTDSGPLYPETLTVGASLTSAVQTRGVRIGGEIQALGKANWLSLTGHLQSALWNVELVDAFEDPVPDYLHDATLGLRADRSLVLSSVRLRPGLSIGASVTDFVIFKLVEEDEEFFVEHEQLLLPAARGGAHLGLESRRIHLDGGLTLEINERVFGVAADAQSTLWVGEHWGLRIQTGMLYRNTPVYYDHDDEISEVGRLQDIHNYLGLGMSWMTPAR